MSEKRPTSFVTLITGAAGGIGAELVKVFGAAGHHIIGVDRDAAGLARLGASLPSQVVWRGMTADLTDTAACQLLIASVLAEFGRLDVLIHNAGITQIGPFIDADPAAIRRVIDVNLLATIELTRPALPALIASRGRIAVMSSVAGIAPLIDRCAYAASKHALHGFFESLRAELSDYGVSVTMVCPSFTQTAIAQNAAGTLDASRTTTGKILTPAAVAASLYTGTMARKRLIFPSLTGRLAWYLSRLAPAWYQKTMTRRIRGRPT